LESIALASPYSALKSNANELSQHCRFPLCAGMTPNRHLHGSGELFKKRKIS